MVNGVLSAASSAAMIERLRRLANEFVDMHHHDRTLALGERQPASLVLAIRPWELDEFRDLRRQRKATPPASQ